ncbi:potassium-transporting ATPase subunit C [Frankia sp. CiP3]|uniref:potassium-transporting ATPase subunit C n=1 Tax=Frankia sp. CiP3 TaxID=2880971 RepID=UPI001EF538AB|nr:potassium-transporting ATPase subunit C [Frankia sp. CiP3]
MFSRVPVWIRQHLAALRAILVFTILLGLGYPLLVLAIAQLPGLKDKADGSFVRDARGTVAGSSLIGQSFTDDKGNPITKYFQSRPSAAGGGYDPTATSASNLGPESIVDTLADPNVTDDSGKQSLLTQVCARSVAIGTLEGVDGSRPNCTPGGVGAVLSVFYDQPGYQGAVTRVVSVNEECPAAPFITSFAGVKVECHTFGDDVSAGKLVVVRGDAPATPAVPADAVTASGSGLDPDISPAYARLQVNRVAKARGLDPAVVRALVDDHVHGRAVGFLGEPTVNVLNLNRALERLR